MDAGCRWNWRLCCWWCWFLVTVLCHCTADDSNNTEPFVATSQWQTVKKGQAVPEGLHVRMNLDSRIVEAKLLDSNEKSQKSLSVVKKENKDNLEDYLKKDSLSLILEMSEGALKRVADSKSKTKFKTLAELKAEFQEMKMEAKSDTEIMHDLFKRYYKLIKEHPLSSQKHKEKLNDEIIDTPSSVEMLAILVDFEYLVHQYDNANEFVRLKGFENIVYPHLNGTDNTLKAEALKVLGSSLQNHIQVQYYALETNAGEKLLKILSLENNEYVKARAIHAMSCLVRGFPTAQKQIVAKHGMDVFHKILLSNNPNYFKLKIPIIVLLDDLVLEHKLILEFHVHGNLADEEKLRQYYDVDLMSKLSNPIFCDILTKLLQEYFDYDSMDMDSMDKITSAMKTFGHFCKHHHYKDKQLLNTFHKIQTVYNNLLLNYKQSNEIESSEEDMEYFSQILGFVDNYINLLNDAKLRDEL